MSKNSKQILEEVVTKVVQKTIKEELKPIKALFYALLKEQVEPTTKSTTETKTTSVMKKESTPVPTTETKINPVLQSLLEQTTPFTGEGPAVIQEGVYVPDSSIDAETNAFANIDYSKFMKKVEEKANNTYRP